MDKITKEDIMSVREELIAVHDCYMELHKAIDNAKKSAPDNIKEVLTKLYGQEVRQYCKFVLNLDELSMFFKKI